MGNDYGIGSLVTLAIVGLCAIPLALWKLGELVWWLVTHMRVTW